MPAAVASISQEKSLRRPLVLQGSVRACPDPGEIAEAVGCSVQPVKDVIADKTAELPKNLNPSSLYQV